MGLTYIASTLIANGYDKIKIIDVLTEGYEKETPFHNDYIRYGLSPEEIKQRIVEYQPDVIGVSCLMSLRKYQSHEICRLAKEVNPRIVTVVGGNHHSCFPRETLADSNIDYCCMGEGETMFLNLVRYLDNKGSFDNVDGIAYRDGSDIAIKPQVYREKNLDNIPFPAHHLLDLNLYKDIWKKQGYHYYEAEKFVCTTFARGCIAKCAHCPHEVLFPGYRYRSGKNIADEFEYVYNTLGVTEIQAHEYNSCVVRKQVEELCHELIKRGLNKKMRWGWPIGIWLKPLDYDFLALMKEAGMFYVDLAIESCSQKLLDRTMPGKDVNLEHTQDVIRWCNSLNYYINCFFMIGFPNQTRQEVEDTIEFAKTLDVNSATFFIAQALPGTKLWDQAMRENLFYDDFDVFHLRYGKSNLKNPYMSRSEIENYRHIARKEFIEHKKKTVNANRYEGIRGENFLKAHQ
jgi:magnesium-protoporphyrin IX monomethyl ester (oxidative) cyclase